MPAEARAAGAVGSTETCSTGAAGAPRFRGAAAATILPSDQLTAQERQIAQFAAEGLSNRDLGQRGHLSPRTVSTHLYRIRAGISRPRRAPGRAQHPQAIR